MIAAPVAEDGGGPKNRNACSTSIANPKIGMPYRPMGVTGFVDLKYKYIPPNRTAISSTNANTEKFQSPRPIFAESAF